MKRAKDKRYRPSVVSSYMKKRDTTEYAVVANTEKTEGAYIRGFFEKARKSIGDRVSVTFTRAKSAAEIISLCDEKRLLERYHSRLWIMFDKDEEKNVDKIIKMAEERKINVAFSASSIEIWFIMYFEIAPEVNDAKEAC